jgi:hypothetical membrane protein
MRTTATALLTPEEPRPNRSVRPSALLWSGVIAGALFVLTFLIAGATRDQYRPLRHPVSSLALGPGGWVQTVNFLACGALMLVFAIGLRRALRGQPGGLIGPLLVLCWGMGLLGAGLFVTDPVSGYPPGTADVVTQPTRSGQLHDLISLFGFLALTVSCLVFARHFAKRRQFGAAVYSLLTGIAFPVGIVLSSLGFGQSHGLVDVAGLIQRLAVSLGWLWLAVLALLVLRARNS